jgi:hypothetical protein
MAARQHANTSLLLSISRSCKISKDFEPFGGQPRQRFAFVRIFGGFWDLRGKLELNNPSPVRLGEQTFPPEIILPPRDLISKKIPGSNSGR